MASLLGHHAVLAERRGRVLRYLPDVAPFAALPDNLTGEDWAAVAELVGPGQNLLAPGLQGSPPPGWEVVASGQGVQLVDAGVTPAPDPEAVLLGAGDVPEMLDLVRRTQPGPFLPRTVELGTYLGIRRDGELVAMAGERLHPPGWTEISAVCTAPEYRGHGLASRLVRAVAQSIRDRDETPFLHAAASNTNAIRLYEAMGFRLRRRMLFAAIRVPAAEVVG
ncbi:MAG TPA: GNAT family N-acetyltransferase [Pseudonocardia sp.]|nr:GNAT family N-acetyltransferase [Pseudonocardia sp.]